MRLWPANDVSASTGPASARRPSPRARPSRGRPVGRPETPEERAVRQRLQERLSAKVGLKHAQGRGSFTVHFGSYAELDEIMRRIQA